MTHFLIFFLFLKILLVIFLCENKIFFFNNARLRLREFLKKKSRMIQKETILIPTDKSGVQLVKTFHLYGGYNRKISFFGNFIKITVKQSKAGCSILKKAKLKGLIVRTKFLNFKADGAFLKFKSNNVILLKKRTTSFGKRMYGPILKSIKRRKLLSSFSKIL